MGVATGPVALRWSNNLSASKEELQSGLTLEGGPLGLRGEKHTVNCGCDWRQTDGCLSEAHTDG